MQLSSSVSPMQDLDKSPVDQVFNFNIEKMQKLLRYVYCDEMNYFVMSVGAAIRTKVLRCKCFNAKAHYF